ncbi:MAG: S41 family peptidase [Verrucomicrobia bacterium]|nr:S41 family peptidase [Verrucomicrobiota bacterium]
MNPSRSLVLVPRFATLLALAAAAVAPAQSSRLTNSPELATLLSFERAPAANSTAPGGWFGGPPTTLAVDVEITHGGKAAARLTRDATSKNDFSTLTASLPVDFAGKRVELRGFLRLEDVSGFAGFWLRQDGSKAQLAFDSMQSRQIKGTSDWTEYSVSLPVHAEARFLVFGVLLGGTGKVWADDLQLLVDGKPIWEAAKVARVETVLERDQEFDRGSKIDLKEVTPLQSQNLATLGRVWGFLKYHHPKVTAGELHWDYELFRIMPSVLAAADRGAANELLAKWIDSYGELKPTDPAKLVRTDGADHLRSQVAWIEAEAVLGKRLSERLRAVYAARPAGDSQFYLSLTPHVGNPSFDHELDYSKVKPDAGHRLLALFRYWNIIRYWSPYRDLIEGDWDQALGDYIPRLASAENANDAQRAFMALIATTHDTHANLWSSLKARPPVGDQQLPAVIRFIEGRATVTRAVAAPGENAPVLRRGDVILELGGAPVPALIKEWTPYYAASNEPTRLRDIARNMGRGPAGPVALRVQRGGETLDVTVTRIPPAAVSRPEDFRHDLPGDTFRLLSDEVAYLKLSSVKLDEVDDYVKKAAGTKGWILDLRNYPSAFLVFALGSHLVEQPTEFARFTKGIASSPGTFTFTDPLKLTPEAPRYPGKVVILVDEVSQSSAEYHTMAFRVAPGAVVVGSTTAGADGNVSNIPLPGGLRSMLSGIGVFYPDKRPTQRIGIIPDVEARPTLAGIREGRDEVLEVGLRQIFGPGKSAEEIRKLIPARD